MNFMLRWRRGGRGWRASRGDREPWLPGVLQQLRVRLVVVPSCNAGVATYDPVARSIADLGWGTVVLANIPPDGTARPDYGLIVRPASPAGPQETGHVESHPLSGLYNHAILLGITGPLFVRYWQNSSAM